MNNKYKYSMDLASYFAEKAVEDTTPDVAEKGIMKRSPSKAAATDTTQEAYDPYSFMPKFAEALKVSFGDPEQGKRFIGSMADQQSEDVRMREVESYMSDLTRRNAIEDVMISLMPNEPESFPSAGTLGEPEGTETLPGAPAVSTSPLGPQAPSPALNLDTPIDIAPVDPTIMDYATESDLSAIESLVDSLMLESNDDKKASAETPEEREQYRGEGLMARTGPSKRAVRDTEGRRTDKFYLDIGIHAESDHGSTPQITNDAREANLPDDQKSRDIGFGHKINAAENASGEIHGIKFKNEDGTFKPLTEKDKRYILKQDMLVHQKAARNAGWDKKLANINTSWDELDAEYQNALTSLAYNVGGTKAGGMWTNVLTAAKNKDVKAFARGLRRKDAGRNTEGMDNRVAKELYYAGLIDSLADVSDELPLATSRNSGIPATAD